MAGLVAAGVGIYSALNSSDTASGVQLPPQFNMPNMSGAADAAYQGIQNIPGAQTGNWAAGLAQQTGQNLYNNPYSGAVQQGANVAGAAGMQQAGAQQGYGNLQSAQGASLYGPAQQILQTGFDPQSALYARTQQQLQDQVRAGEAARGVATSPYGAGLENQAMSNFNIDWQNAQLGRQATAGQAASALTGAGGTAIDQGQQLAAAAPGQFLQSAMMPYQAYNTIGQGQNSALAGALGTTQAAQQVSAYPAQQNLAYLGTGNQAAGVANQNAAIGLQQANMAFNQNQTLGANLGKSIQGLSNPNAWNWMNQPSSGGSGGSSGATGWGSTGGGYGTGGVY